MTNSPRPVSAEAPLIMAGYSMAVLAALAKLLPAGSVICVEEPDVLRKRGAHDAAAGSAALRELAAWEYNHDGAADRWYLGHRDLQPAAVVPITEYSVPFAARLAERYGVPGAGYGAARLLRDKHLLRQVTAAAGIANPESAEVRGPAEVAAFFRRWGGPVVLKPANRQAAVGTKILHAASQAAAAWAECTDQDEGVFVPDRGMELRMLAERCVRGAEYSVEMMLRAGEPVFGAVTRKYLFAGDRPVEQGHVHPADISPGLTGLLISSTRAVLAAVGMGTGFVHCEWIVENGVPFLVECAGRPPGDGIVDLAVAAWDYDLPGQFFAMMAGQPLAGPPPERPARWAAIWMAAPEETGVVDSVGGVAAAEQAPGVQHVVTAEIGAPAAALRSSWDRLGSVMAVGDTAADALQCAQQGMAMISFKVRPAVPG